MTEQETITTQVKRERIYEDIETKVDIVAGIWEFTRNLPVPSPDDPPEMINGGKQAVNGAESKEEAQGE